MVQALLKSVPRSNIRGIYLKGSSLKTWQTPVDYVPELSDVDVHVWLSRDDAWPQYFDPPERAVSMSARIEDLYGEAVSQPIHTPRIQLVIANELYQKPDYVPSPSQSVRVRLGEPYPFHEVDPNTRRATVRKQLLDQGEYLQKLGPSIVEAVGKHLRLILRGMSWRVSPTAPRVLELADVPFDDSWASNRTGLIRLLSSIGEDDLAHSYAEFYLRSWDYFLSGDDDSGAARSAILAGARVVRRGIELAHASDTPNLFG